MAWTISGDTGEAPVGIHPNSGVITYKEKCTCQPSASCCDKKPEPITITASLLSGASFDNFTTCRTEITYSYTMESCNRDGFVTWFKNNNDEHYPVLNNNNGFDNKYVDECDLLVQGAPLLAGSGYSQFFPNSSYQDSGYPSIIEDPYATTAVSASCSGTSGCNKYHDTVTNGANHKIKYHTSEATSGIIRTNTITNNQHLTELYFPHTYENIISSVTDEHFDYQQFEGSNIHIIQDRAFEDNKQLSAITFSAVREIGASAFTNCHSLVNIDWGHCRCYSADSYSSNYNQDHQIGQIDLASMYTWQERVIGSHAFYNCHSLPVLQLDRLKQLGTLGSHAFYNCSGLTSLTLPTNSKYKKIEEYTFWNCNVLPSVTFPSNIRDIGDHAFENGYALQELDLRTVSGIGKSAFENCSGLTSVSACTSADTTLGDRAFANCISLNTFNLRGYTSGKESFANCSGLTSVSNLHDSVGESAFTDCTSLQTIECSGKFDIGAHAFENCESLNNITLGYGYIGVSGTSIGDYAFQGCSGLTRVTINCGHGFEENIFVPKIGESAFTENLTTLEINVGSETAKEMFIADDAWSAYADNIVSEFTDDNQG